MLLTSKARAISSQKARQAGKIKARKSKVVDHLWQIQFEHRDYLRTVNYGKEFRTSSHIWVVCSQPVANQESIGMATTKAIRYLDRHKRDYADYVIKNVSYHGKIAK